MQMTSEAAVILTISLLIIITNVLTLLVLFRTEMMLTTNRYFLASLTVADLLLGTFYTPFAFWASVFDRWIYGDRFCHLQAYFAAILWIGSLYSLTWLCIDHHIAARKPDRYASLMTSTRSRCWLTLLWVAAFSFCCPALLGSDFGSRFYHEAFICVVDWRPQRAYVMTSAALIVLPPLVTLAASNMYMFSAAYRTERRVTASCIEANIRHERYVVVSLVTVAFLCTWLPLLSLQITDMATASTVHVITNGVHTEVVQTSPIFADLSPHMHFAFCWLALSNSFIKFVFYLLFDHDFRAGLCLIYSNSSCCKCSQ